MSDDISTDTFGTADPDFAGDPMLLVRRRAGPRVRD